jgi:hypothetical protein
MCLDRFNILMSRITSIIKMMYFQAKNKLKRNRYCNVKHYFNMHNLKSNFRAS